jgi:NodT family efflux transporter outer membrane factor (OMF) lipoprotein
MDTTEMTGRVRFEGRRSGCDPVRTGSVWMLAGLLVGCTAGPDFVRPATPEISNYTTTSATARTASSPTAFGEVQRISEGARVSAQWWRAFGSASLNSLVEQAFQANPTLASARATLRQAHEVYAAQAGATLFPQASIGFGAQRQRLNPSGLGQAGDAREFSLYSASVGMHYQVDLAGGNRRALEALEARVEYRYFQMEAAQLTLAGNVVTTAIAQARIAAQIGATETILRAQDEQLQIARERVRLGQGAPDDVLTLQALVEQTRAGLPSLRKQLRQSEHLLAVFIGRAPGAGAIPSFSLDEISLPSDLPLVLPSELVRTRPDIQAAEALLHAANAEYGVAVAKLYPQLNLSANLGSQALSTGALFGGGSTVWNLIGQLTQPLFNLGLPAEKRASLAALDTAAANYQYVVLEALRNVADILRALESGAQTSEFLANADVAAQQSLASMRRQYALGAASYVQVLIAEQQAQQNRINLIVARAQRLVDSAALYQALGGAVGQRDT